MPRWTLRGKLILFYVLVALSPLALAHKGHPLPIVSAPGTRSSDKQIIVGRNIQVSKGLENDAHYEVLLAADAKNPNNLLGCSIVFSEEKNKWIIVAYVSFNGGKTWSPALTVDKVDESPCCNVDPAVAYGPDGTAYLIFFGPTPDIRYELYVYNSKDGGKTWLPPSKLPVMDRPYVVVDDTGGKYHGRVYIHGTRSMRGIDGGSPSNTFTIYYSIDDGATFEMSRQLVSAGNHRILGNAGGVVLSDGTLVCLFGELQNGTNLEEKPSKPNAQMKVIASHDGGETFSKAVVISDYALPRTWTSTGIPYLAVDRSKGSFKDRLYAVYPDVRSGRVEIMFAYSSDQGKNWSKPVVVNDDRPPSDTANGPDHFMPVVAVNRDGVVGVIWYDRRESSNNLDWSVRFTASLDGGETFVPSVRVSEASFTHGKEDKWVVQAWGSGGGHNWISERLRGGSLKLDLVLPGLIYMRGGDTAGLAAAANGVFHPFWVDNRTGVPQIWTAPVTVKGNVIRNGDLDLAGLEDISEKVIINYTNTHYDRSTNILSVDAQLVNVSEETISGPIKARVISLKSDVGIPKILTADNGEKDVGAVWDFSPLLRDNHLKPKQNVEVKRLEFSLSDLRPLKPPSISNSGIGLIRIEAKVLGKVGKKSGLN